MGYTVAVFKNLVWYHIHKPHTGEYTVFYSGYDRSMESRQRTGPHTTAIEASYNYVVRPILPYVNVYVICLPRLLIRKLRLQLLGCQLRQTSTVKQSWRSCGISSSQRATPHQMPQRSPCSAVGPTLQVSEILGRQDPWQEAWGDECTDYEDDSSEPLWKKLKIVDIFDERVDLCSDN